MLLNSSYRLKKLKWLVNIVDDGIFVTPSVKMTDNEKV